MYAVISPFSYNTYFRAIIINNRDRKLPSILQWTFQILNRPFITKVTDDDNDNFALNNFKH